MTARTIDCAECGASVAYGRLSCPECGALLASLAGAATPATRPSATPLNPPDSIDDPIPVEPVATTVVGPAVAVAVPSIPSVLRDSPNVVRAPAFVPAIAGGAPVLAGGRGRDRADESGWTDTSPDRPPTTIGPSSMDASRVAEVAGWFILVGAAMSVLGFLLPWSRVVIGAGSYGGYLSTWGLASPTHLFVFVVIVGLLAVAIASSGPRCRPGWPSGSSGSGSAACCSASPGRTWSGRSARRLGVLIVGLGGLALVIGGALSVWASRHLEADRPSDPADGAQPAERPLLHCPERIRGVPRSPWPW